jgi:hypothetical protein
LTKNLILQFRSQKFDDLVSIKLSQFSLWVWAPGSASHGIVDVGNGGYIQERRICRCSNGTFFASLYASYITTSTVEMQFVQRLLLLFKKLFKRNIGTSKRKIKLMVIKFSFCRSLRAAFVAAILLTKLTKIYIISYTDTNVCKSLRII